MHCPKYGIGILYVVEFLRLILLRSNRKWLIYYAWSAIFNVPNVLTIWL